MNDNKVIIFHHNDMDGKVSAALIYAYEYYYKMTKSINITCKEIDYTVLLNDDISSISYSLILYPGFPLPCPSGEYIFRTNLVLSFLYT